MNRGRTAALALALSGFLLAALPSLAAARMAYVTVEDPTTAQQGAVRVNLATGLPDPAISFGGGEGPAQDVAITPDGTRAYVLDFGNTGDEVSPIVVATNSPETPIPLGGFVSAQAIAIAPNGAAAYVTGGSSVYKVDLAKKEVVDVISLPGASFTAGIAITPDGTHAYATAEEGGEGVVFPIDLSTSLAGAAIPAGESAGGIAITPDGTHAYVTDRQEGTVHRISLTSGAADATIAVLGSPEQIAITPDGTRAYVTSFSDFVTPINLTSGETGEVEFGNQFLGDVAILPDGSHAYVTDTESEEELVPIAIPSNSLGTAIPVTRRPSAIAIVPNQPPHAAFTTSPSTVAPGESVAFNASGSTDSDGTVARYDWEFGDGSAAANGGAKPSHTYAKAGTYTVALTTTDNEGCSTMFVFTGQTAYCNGSSVARVSHQVTVAAASCPTVKGGASSFVPKFRSSRVVPGVRVRLSTSAPARLDVAATLAWSKDGGGSADLGKTSSVVQHWRRVRFPIPSSLGDKLPLGTPVKVKLTITATPTQGSGCAGSVTHRTLKVKVVKVIPDAVQFKRAR